MPNTTPSTLTPLVRRYRATSSGSPALWPELTPALSTTRSSRPYASTARATIATFRPWSLTSTSTAVPPSRPAVWRACAPSTSAATSRYPRPASRTTTELAGVPDTVAVAVNSVPPSSGQFFSLDDALTENGPGALEVALTEVGVGLRLGLGLAEGERDGEAVAPRGPGVSVDSGTADPDVGTPPIWAGTTGGPAAAGPGLASDRASA